MRSYLHHVAFAAALLALPSCSLVVGGQEPIPCVREETNACPEGTTCIRRVCTPIDCDADGDGFGCDGTADCDDTNRNINPMAMEICDGRDNNCDDIVDVDVCPSSEGCGQRGGEYQCLSLTDCYLGLSQCAPTERCNPDTGRCGPPPSTDCNMQPCAGTGRCDSLTGICLEPLSLGESCVRDVECSTDHCFPRASLGYAASGSVCSEPCSANSDCTGTARGMCRASGTGARGCVPMTATPPASACTRDADCGMERCRLDDSGTFVCGPAAGPAGPGGVCEFDSECASGACLAEEGGFNTVCFAPCGVRGDCAAGEICRFRDTNPDSSRTWVTVCADVVGGTGEQGAPCTALNGFAVCRERYCAVDSPRYCANVCTRDSECGSGYTCRPVNNNGWELRCLRR